MRKIIGIFLVITLIASSITLAFADETSEEVEIDEEVKKEAGIMDSKLGAEIRLLQLEKAISRNIFKAEKTISFLQEDTNENDTEKLEGILWTMKLLKEDVQSADPNSSDAVQTFVDLKTDAIELTKDFRETLYQILDNETKFLLKERLRKNETNTSIENITQRIRKHIRKYNSHQIGKVSGYTGKVNDSLIKEYENKTCSLQQVKQNIKQKVNNMVKEKRKQFFSEFKENKIKNRVRAQECIQNATEGFQERRQQRIENRLNKSKSMGNGPSKGPSKENKEQIQQYLEDKVGKKIGPGDQNKGQTPGPGKGGGG
ncbi:MAG: hypothetical protein V5A68_02085 [Candidatus Thermoplasmatota archaeon]